MPSVGGADGSHIRNCCQTRSSGAWANARPASPSTKVPMATEVNTRMNVRRKFWVALETVIMKCPPFAFQGSVHCGAQLLSELFRQRHRWPPIPNSPVRVEPRHLDLYRLLATRKSR